jgi:hypothetical protein
MYITLIVPSVGKFKFLDYLTGPITLGFDQSVKDFKGEKNVFPEDFVRI